MCRPHKLSTPSLPQCLFQNLIINIIINIIEIIIIINMCRPHKLSTPSLPEWEVREKRQTGVTVTKLFNILKCDTFEYFETVRNG